MPGIVTNQDYTKQINDAFEALKYASPQQLQFVGQQVQGNQQSPEALALAMATQFQQAARQPRPAPPQGTVLQQKLASLAPQGPGIGTVAPNQMAFNQAAQQDPMRNAGIGAAPENTQQMATGGLVALAHGGPVRGYADGRSVELDNDTLDSSLDQYINPYTHHTSKNAEPEFSDFERRHPAVANNTDDNKFGALGQYVSDAGRGFNTLWEDTNRSLGGSSNDAMSDDDYDILEKKGAFGPRRPSWLEKLSSAMRTSERPHDGAGIPAAKVENPTPSTPPTPTPASPANDKSPSPQMPKTDLVSSDSTTPTTTPSGSGNQTIVVDTGDEPTPTPVSERTSDGSSSKVPKLSFDKQVEGLASLFAGDHAKAAELKGAMEKRLAESSKSHNLEDVAAGIAGMLSGQGYLSQRLGTGVLMGLASRGRHGSEEETLQSKIDALGLNEETQSNAARHEALKSVLGTQAKSAEMQQEQLNKLAQIRLENEGKVNSATARAGGDKNGLKEYQKGQLQDMAVQAAQRESGFNNLNDTEKQQRVEYYMDMYRNMIPSLPQTAQTVNTPVPRVAYQPPPTR